MAIQTKICGLTTPEAVDAAVAGGVAFIGFVFYPPSPRIISARDAATLIERMSEDVRSVGVFVDPDDALLENTLARAPLDMIQLHGNEPPERVADVEARFGRSVIKAILVRDAGDVKAARAYQDAAKYLLFDAKPLAGDECALPGGNGVAFDRLLLDGQNGSQLRSRPWFLSGGLTAATLPAAIAATGAALVDVSSGVETAPGQKDAGMITEFLAAADGCK